LGALTHVFCPVEEAAEVLESEDAEGNGKDDGAEEIVNAEEAEETIELEEACMRTEVKFEVILT